MAMKGERRGRKVRPEALNRIAACTCPPHTLVEPREVEGNHGYLSVHFGRRESGVVGEQGPDQDSGKATQV